MDLPRASSIAPVALSSARNASASKARSSRTSMPGSQQRQQPPGQGGLVPVGRRAEGGAEQATGAGLGQGHHAAAWGTRQSPSGSGSCPARTGCGRCRAPSASCSRRTRRCAARGSVTPGVCGWASGPATTSNSAFNGAGPSRRRRSRSAFSDGHGTIQAGQPGGQLRPHPRIAQAREQPQREHEVHPDPRRQIAQPRCTVLV